MRITTILILIVIATFLFVGQATYQSDVKYEKERDIYNFTESTINWNYNFTDILSGEATNDVQILEYDINIRRFKGILVKFIDFVGYSSFEIAKWGVEYGYTHPEYDLKFFLNVLIKILWICVIIALVPLIIPIIALLYLFFKGIGCLIKKIFKKNEKIKKT